MIIKLDTLERLNHIEKILTKVLENKESISYDIFRCLHEIKIIKVENQIGKLVDKISLLEMESNPYRH